MNISKSKSMVIHSSRRNIVRRLQLRVGGLDVEQAHCFKFLGVLINDTLTWSDHVNMVSNKVARSLSLLRRLSWFLPQSLLLYVKSCIFPSFDYCDVVWSGCTKAEALRLQTLFNFACRTVLHRRRDYSASAAHRQLGLSTLSSGRNLHLTQTMFKCLSFQSPPYLSQLFLCYFHPLQHSFFIIPQLELPLGRRLSVLLGLHSGHLFQLTLGHLLTTKLLPTAVMISSRTLTKQFTSHTIACSLSTDSIIYN